MAIGILVISVLPIVVFIQQDTASIRAIKNRFPDISAWDISLDETPSKLFTGDCVFYNADENSFEPKNVNLEAISVIVIYTKWETTQEYVYVRSGDYYASVTVENIRITLVNAETQRSFASKSFPEGDPSYSGLSPGTNRRGKNYDDREIVTFVESHFTK